ncbi:hypothetical protein DM01DRAFT_1332218 [Hesseltinella vesiculosa]|uniref:Uncharacterized protein n=1 Tax=Hesseltinella vesiculosa TaxID=101127 RepID=A0A1X2GUC6_9FUNG|nr:hypothetical protein DM01DRAFT_1332218 [Hesseltinella vesiculosa]
MLRSHTQRLGQQLRPTLFAVRYESTSSEAAAPLSQRLGGTGRGKIMEGKANDVFGAFLAQSQRREKAKSENKQRRSNQKRRQDKPGQFDDAVASSPAQRKTQSGRPNQSNQPNQRSRPQQQRSQQKQAKPRTMPKRNGIAATPTRRATTFIDKDIDWDTLALSEQQIDSQQDQTQEQPLDSELKLGDYSRYVSVGESISWPDTLPTNALTSLVGTNASYDLNQKTAFLSTVAKATQGVSAGQK